MPTMTLTEKEAKVVECLRVYCDKHSSWSNAPKDAATADEVQRAAYNQIEGAIREAAE